MVCVRSFVTKEAATLVHNTLILSLFDHCDIAWSNLLQQDMDRLQRLQNISALAGTRLREKGKKRGQIGKVSASEASPAIAWGWGKLPRLPLGSLCSPIFFFFGPTPIFFLFPQCGAWFQAKICPDNLTLYTLIWGNGAAALADSFQRTLLPQG